MQNLNGKVIINKGMFQAKFEFDDSQIDDLSISEMHAVIRNFSYWAAKSAGEKGENYYIRNSWIEVASKGMDHQVHNHGGLGLSAIVYLDYNPKYHSPTGFISLTNHFDTGTSSLYFPNDIDDGSLVVFPSVVNHFSKRNDSDVPRTILSFNMGKRPNYM
jgi:hypothetical protein